MNELPPPVRSWLDAATLDAERRGLPQLVPMLDALARATATLRRASWNDEASDQRATAR